MEKNEENVTLAQLFNVDASLFKNIKVSVLNLSVRSSKRLISEKIDTIQQLLGATVKDLNGIRGMGVNSVSEILQKSKEYIKSAEPFEGEDKQVDLGDLEKFKDVVEAILLDNSYSLNGLNESQIQRAKEMKEAVNTLGSEICLEMYLNPQSGTELLCALRTFANENLNNFTLIEKVEKKVSLLPKTIKGKKLVPFICAYQDNVKNSLGKLLRYCNADTVVAQFSTVLGMCLKDNDDSSLRKKSVDFVSFLSLDFERLFDRLCQKACSEISKKSDRSFDIILQRAKGATLESLGEHYAITRERVRQIENKAYKIFLRECKKLEYDPIMLIYALNDGSPIICFEDIHGFFKEQFSFILWEWLRNNKEKGSYYYSPMLEAVIIKSAFLQDDNQDINEAVEYLILDLPLIFEESQKAQLIEELFQKSSVSKDLIDRAICFMYKHTNQFYHRGALTISFICEYILKNKFSSGFKTGDPVESDKFRNYASELFGKKGENLSNRAIDAKIGIIGVLCGRGKYIHPDFLHVEQGVIEAINDYIEKSPRQLLTYGEIYENLKELFVGTQITDRYWLQGALKKYGCKFYKGRDYVRKDTNVNFIDEIESFVEERGIVHKSELFDEFASLNDARLSQVVDRSENVYNINNGYYIHVNQFDLRTDDYVVLRSYLSQMCNDIPVSINSIYKGAEKEASDFMKRNQFGDADEMFAALKFMFAGEFGFSHKYISKLDEGITTSKSVILQHIEAFDTVEIEKLFDICDSNEIKYVSSGMLTNKLAPEYLRISATTLMKQGLIGITDEVAKETVGIIKDMLAKNDYIAGHLINDYVCFPQINVEWNEFVLFSIILMSGQVNIVYIPRGAQTQINAIYVSDKYKKESYDSMLIKILTQKTKNKPFRSKEEMQERLFEEGLIGKKLPKFLENETQFYQY